MAVQRGRSERRGESYSVPYAETLSDATCLREALRRRQGTKLAGFFSILLEFVGDLLFCMVGASDQRA